MGDVDCSAGGLVWVRRRNGSWWPGKILGTEELSASQLASSPKSGTPVKLLGRDDASVDWYNLEKSKRVKAFRCGEFDDCINKVENLQGATATSASIKTRETYARRKDAIIHALELEREKLVKKQVNTRRSTILKELPTSSQRLAKANIKSHSVTGSKLPSFLKDKCSAKSTQISGKEDKIQAMPRMRGLQDFGLRIAPKRRKAFVSLLSEDTPRHTFADHVLPHASQPTLSSTTTILASKRKRTQGGLIEESVNKRRDRRRPLYQVLQNSVQMSADQASPSNGDVSPSMVGEKEQTGIVLRGKRTQCVYLPVDPNGNLDHTGCPSDEMQIAAANFGTNNFHIIPFSLKEENTTSRLMEEAKSDSSSSDQDIDEEVPSEATETQLMEGPSDGCTEEKSESTSNEELDESVIVKPYRSIHYPYDQAGTAADVGVSKWKLKGKRNIRNTMKRSNESTDVTCLEGKGKWSNQKALRLQSRYNDSGVLDYDYDEDAMIEKNSMHDKMIGCGMRRYPSKLEDLSKDCVGKSNLGEDSIWETDRLCEEAFRGYSDKSSCQDSVYDGSYLGSAEKSMLVDVDLKVQASYQGEHVPLVSLLSRLNGKAIIGYPIQIEALEDGSSEMFLSTNKDFGEAIDDVTPAWRTGRRTTMHRIPRTGLDARGDPVLYSDEVVGKSCDPTELRGTKRPKKKASFSSRKTRRLPSVATKRKLKCKVGNHKAVKRNGLIKPEKGPTCIPLKLVFGRLRQAVEAW